MTYYRIISIFHLMEINIIPTTPLPCWSNLLLSMIRYPASWRVCANQLQSFISIRQKPFQWPPPLKPMSCWLWLDIQEAKGQRAVFPPWLAGQTMLLYSHTQTYLYLASITIRGHHHHFITALIKTTVHVYAQ